MGDTSVTAGEIFLKEKRTVGFCIEKKRRKNNKTIICLKSLLVSYQEAVLVPNLSSFCLISFSCVCHFQVSSLENPLAAYSDAAGIKGNIRHIIII